MKHDAIIEQVITIIREKTKQSPEPMTREIIRLYGKNPYLILISCLLSLQARDVVTLPVSIRLFEYVRTVQQMVEISLSQLEELIKSMNYYKTKALRLKSVSQELLQRFGGTVPKTEQELLSIKGVGIKTANLVLAEAYDIPAICVDTHVHRLSNHWGLIQTKTPEQSEKALRNVLPQQYWIAWNYYLVKWGQNVCKFEKADCKHCQDIMNILAQ